MTSTWSWVDHKVSRLPPLTKRPIQTRFRFGSVSLTLNLAREEQLVGSLCKRHAVTLRRAPTACKRMVSGTISLPCSGFFSPFLHSTGSLSVSQEYLALRDGPRRFRQDFSCPALLRILARNKTVTHTGLSPSMVQLSRRFRFRFYYPMQVLQPRRCQNNSGLGYFAFARHYSQNHYCFLLLWVLRCFSSPRSLLFHRYQAFSLMGCPIRTSADQRLFAPPRSLSQLITSFIASESQGIPHTLLIHFLRLLM